MVGPRQGSDSYICGVRAMKKSHVIAASVFLALTLFGIILFSRPKLDSAQAFEALQDCLSHPGRRCYHKGGANERNVRDAKFSNVPVSSSDGKKIVWYRFSSRDRSLCAHVEFIPGSLFGTEYTVEIYKCDQQGNIDIGIA